MIFSKITICNLFSYQGEHVFNLGLPTKNKNIVIISGRNGNGKTSFLRCLILLFSGTEGKFVQMLSGLSRANRNKFLMGDPPYWDGLYNKVARRQGKKDYYVEVEWVEENSKWVLARRAWDSTTNKEKLSIVVDGVELSIDDSQVYLESKLPSELVRYFFFDGELIKSIAEADGDDSFQFSEHSYRLLGLQQVLNLRKQALEALKQLRNKYATAELKTNHAFLLGNLQASVNKIEEFSEEIEALELELTETVDSLVRIERELKRLVHAENEVDLRKIEEKIKNTQELLIDEHRRFVEFACFDLPLTANDELLRSVQEKVDQFSASDGFEVRSVLEKLSKSIPEQLFGLPPFSDPKLSLKQEGFYKEKLQQTLLVYAENFSTESVYAFSAEKASYLREKFYDVLSKAQTNRNVASHSLTQIENLNAKIELFEAEKLDAALISASVREKYVEFKEVAGQLALTQANQRAIIAQKGLELNREQKKKVELSEMVARVATKIDKATEGKKQVQLLKKCITSLDSYSNKLREHYRNAIESEMDGKLKILFDSSSLIKSIRLDESFLPELVGEDGNVVSIYSTSAGTRQLIATALLWALKDVSQKRIPVAIDTPLARIDKEHQLNLLNKFYPAVSEQVIILPTTSEIDEEKLQLLSKHVYKIFELSNDSGISTQVSEKSVS